MASTVSSTAAAVSAFFVPDKAISPVVVAVFDPGVGGYLGFEDVAISDVGRPFWMALDSALYRPVVPPIFRQSVCFWYLMAMTEVAIKITMRQRLGVLTNFILLGEIRGFVWRRICL